MGTMNWRPLPHFQGIPALLVSPSFGANSYTLHLSDLANVWVETLDRKGIVKRSLNEDTSIDPTEGTDQMPLLLAKIQSAFDPSSPDHHQTSLVLTALSGADQGSLLLTITCALPGGLKPLVWPFQLAQCPSSSVASQLVLPLIQAQHTRAREVEELIVNLKEKDAVISRLVEKLAATGTGLENVFHSLSTERKVSMAVAEQKVKGLAPFKEVKWRSSPMADGDVDVPEDVLSLLGVFFEPIHLPHVEVNVSSDDLNEWWTKIGSKPIATVARSSQHPVSSRDPQPQEEKHSSDDDDFQVQATPPNLASRRRGNKNVDDDDGTADEDEVKPVPDSHPPPSEHRRSRLGTIGKHKTAKATSVSHPFRPATAAAAAAAADDDDTASESDIEPSTASTTSKPLSTNQTSRPTGPADDDTASESDAVPAKSSRLGVAGKTKTARAADDTASESDAAPAKPDFKSKAPSRLGTIGKPKPTQSPAKSSSPALPQQRDDDTATDSEEDRPAKPKTANPLKESTAQRKRGGLGRIGGKTPATEVERAGSETGSEGAKSPRPAGRRLGVIGKRKPEVEKPGPSAADEVETDEQKAERKRVELAKELERKAAAPPAKKKRRF